MDEINLDLKKKAYDELLEEYKTKIESIPEKIENLQLEKYKYKIKENIYINSGDQDKITKNNECLKDINEKIEELKEKDDELNNELEVLERLNTLFIKNMSYSNN